MFNYVTSSIKLSNYQFEDILTFALLEKNWTWTNITLISYGSENRRIQLNDNYNSVKKTKMNGGWEEETMRLMG